MGKGREGQHGDTLKALGLAHQDTRTHTQDTCTNTSRHTHSHSKIHARTLKTHLIFRQAHCLSRPLVSLQILSADV